MTQPVTDPQAQRRTDALRAPSLPGRFVWHDLMTTDPARALDFYSRLFGWTTRQMDMGGGWTYTMWMKDEHMVGGMVPLDASHGVPSHWIGYVTVPDVDAACARAGSLGGKACVPGTDIPGVGRFAVVEDPAGAVFSPFTGQNEERPDDGTPAPPGTFCWDELLTPDPERAVAFYRSLLGWEVTVVDMPMGRYWLFKRGGRDAAGLMPMPPGAEARPFWLPYVAATDVDATAASVERLGGRIFVRPTDIPGVGRFAVAADPTGASFAVYRKAGA